MKKTIYILSLIISLAFLSNCSNSGSSSSNENRCSSSDAKSVLLSDMTSKGFSLINCTLKSADNKNCDYLFDVTYSDGTSTLMNIYESNNKWVIKVRK